jgi:hypothetical protein
MRLPRYLATTAGAGGSDEQERMKIVTPRNNRERFTFRSRTEPIPAGFFFTRRVKNEA